ncbi:HpcH/HpaI aldolase/citrate lyase family protein [Bacillus tianshenii]|nr:HpcH/HpaI aldolase/citrate lyase family protein [Bacillus tianshenii]
MQYFHYLTDFQREGLFYQTPYSFTKDSPKEFLELALGAVLYMPATRTDLESLLIEKKYEELASLVICLEDAVSDFEVAEAEDNAVKRIRMVYDSVKRGKVSIEELPLIFIRVRSPQQMMRLFPRLEESIKIVAGCVFPKFSQANCQEYLDNLKAIQRETGAGLYGMPIFEAPEILYKESRLDSLLTIRQTLSAYQEDILNIRIGATDFCGLYGIRRDCYTSIYDVSLIRDVITDIVNLFGRDYVISGPVWEYFDSKERLFKPQLRRTPFRQAYGERGLEVRSQLLDNNLDGLIQETYLDLANGLHGKTIIHPTHIKPVQAMHVVTYEEFIDASMIMNQAEGNNGVFKSEYGNKMNETKPHFKWAQKTIRKSKIYGVFHENHKYIDLLTEPIKI